MALADLSRPQWGGPNADVDIHIEEHLGIVDASFQYNSKFAGITNTRSLRGSNQVRLDRVGSVAVAGRRVGEPLVTSTVKNDKFTLTVDTLLYTRHEFDHFDQWTSSLDLRKEVAREDGIALAKQYDLACITQLQKAGDFVAPAHLAGAFYDGVVLPVSVVGTAAAGEADADLLVYQHRQGIQTFVNRDLGDQVMSEGITLVTPRVFTILLEHNKLTNVDYGAGEAGNSFAMGRVARLHGVRIVETPRFAAAAITASPLGADFNLTADQIKREMITFIPSLALVAAQVHPVTAKYWEDERAFAMVLDTFQSYTIGARRPDAVVTHAVTYTG